MYVLTIDFYTTEGTIRDLKRITQTYSTKEELLDLLEACIKPNLIVQATWHYVDSSTMANSMHNIVNKMEDE